MVVKTALRTLHCTFRVDACFELTSCFGGGGGNDCLNLIFGKISHRFTRDFTNTDKKKSKMTAILCENYFNRKSVEVQR